MKTSPNPNEKYTPSLQGCDKTPAWSQIQNYFDYIAIVNYPCYYCNGFQPHNRELKGWPRGSPGFCLAAQHPFKAHPMLCRVESYSGFRLHERPRRFTWGETWLDIDRIMEQWVTPSSYCFKVRVDERVFRLEYHRSRDVWEVDLLRP